MSIYGVVLSNAFVALLTAPLRRLRYLISVEDDLIEEGALPPQGFGGVFGCARFLYLAGGRTYTVFYRGAVLEALGCIGKYELQRIISIPIGRRVPLRMQQNYLATTFLHTALVYFTVAPLQTALDTIAVNSVTDFTVEERAKLEEAQDGSKASSTESGAAAAAAAAKAAHAPRAHLRFSSAWETTKYLAHHFPVWSMVSRLYLLDFAIRYVSSLANNAILGWLMRAAERRYAGAEMTTVQRLVMYAGCPLVASLAMSLLTYPIASYPVAHFLRLHYYERRQQAEAQAAAEAAQDYPTSAQQQRQQSADPHNTESANNNNSKSSNSNSASFAARKAGRRDEDERNGGVERFWWEEVFYHSLHEELRAYLWKSMYGREVVGVSTSTTPTTASPTTPAAALQCPAGAGGRKRGVQQIYRGFGLAVATSVVSTALAIGLNTAVDLVHHRGLH